MWSRIFSKLTVMILAVHFLLNPVFASIVELDTTFNAVGYVTHGAAAGGVNGTDTGYSVLIDNNGKYVVTGQSRNAAGNDDMAIWRYNTDGTLDTTFNTVGYVVHTGAAGGVGSDVGNAIVQTTDNTYVVVGTSRNAAGNADLAIWRYNYNGTLDTSFNGTGFAVHTAAAGGVGTDLGSSVVIQSDGKYVISGQSRNGAGNDDMVIWRYNTNGTLDTTFNTVGYVVHTGAAGGVGGDSGSAITIQNDGKYVVAGWSYNASANFDLAIWRYNTDGTLDSTFNSVGYVTKNNSAGVNTLDLGLSVTLQSDQKIVIAGYGTSASNGYDIVVWRYNTNGSIDTSFDTDGLYTNNFSSTSNFDDAIYGFSRSIRIDSAGKIVLVGFAKIPASTTDLIIVRLNTDGTLDTTFNLTGYISHPIAFGNDMGYSVIIDAEGRYVIAGYSRNAALNFDMTIWRYNNKFQIDQLNVDLDATLLGTNIETDTLNGDYGTQTIRLEKSGLVLADIVANLYEDLDWSTVEGDQDLVLGKTFINNIASAPGVVGNHVLYIPKLIGYNGVRICPEANSFVSTTTSCTNGYDLEDGDLGLTSVTIGANDYWRVENVAGSGGMNIIIAAPTNTPTPVATITVTQTPMPTPTSTTQPDELTQTGSSLVPALVIFTTILLSCVKILTLKKHI